MNLIQKRLHQRTANTPRPQILRLLQDISEESDSLPAVLFLNEVIRDRKMGGGGEADIWLGEIQGLRVVLRDVRLPEDTLGREVAMKVRDMISAGGNSFTQQPFSISDVRFLRFSPSFIPTSCHSLEFGLTPLTLSRSSMHSQKMGQQESFWHGTPGVFFILLKGLRPPSSFCTI